MQTSLEQLNVKNTNSDSFDYCLDIKGTFQIEYKLSSDSLCGIMLITKKITTFKSITKKVNASKSVNVKILTVSKV